MDFPETLLRLTQIDSNEKINIVSDNMICPINKSLAIAISPIFFQAIKENPMIQQISLPINENIKEFFNGKSINKELFFIMSIVLDNKDLLKQSKRVITIDPNNAINHLIKFINYKVQKENIDEEIEFIGENFDELEEKIEFDKIPSEYLSEILKKAKGVQTEKQMLKYILQRLKVENDEINQEKLINSIDLRGLNNDDIKELIKSIKYENLSKQLFSIMKEKFLSFELKQEDIAKYQEIGKSNDILIFFLKYQQDSYYKDDPNGFSPLHYAVINNLKEFVEILISKGANINAKTLFYKIIERLFLIRVI